MNRQLMDHLIHHAPRGFGDTPANCPVCPHTHDDLAARITALETHGLPNGSPAPAGSGLWAKIALGATTSIVAAYVIERFVRKKG